MHVLLASSSPRRLSLLQAAGLVIQVVKPNIDESPLPGESPHELVQRLAWQKAQAVEHKVPSQLPIIAADTMVVIGDSAIGKPRDTEHARSILRRLSGQKHHVVTGVVVGGQTQYHRFVVTTCVTFRPLIDSVINAYVSQTEWVGKAGGYAIQGAAETFVDRIEGSYTNVVGLPLPQVLQALGAND